MTKDDDKIIRNVCEEKEFLLPESRYRKQRKEKQCEVKKMDVFYLKERKKKDRQK